MKRRRAQRLRHPRSPDGISNHAETPDRRDRCRASGENGGPPGNQPLVDRAVPAIIQESLAYENCEGKPGRWFRQTFPREVLRTIREDLREKTAGATHPIARGNRSVWQNLRALPNECCSGHLCRQREIFVPAKPSV